MGDPEEEGLYTLGSMQHRRTMRKLRHALMGAREAWEEAAIRWGCNAGDSVDDIAATVLAGLESARARIAGSLAQLQRADADLYELAMIEVGEDAEEAADTVTGLAETHG